MKIVISPAKSLDFDKNIPTEIYSQNIFEKESQQLINKLKKLSKKKLGELMKLSPQLVELNHQRYQEWNLPFSPTNAKQAGYVFTGEVYRGLDFDSFSEKEINVAQDKLRILSGLYGLLKPLDLIQPYRLEMGTRLNYSTKTKNLYQFWDNKITEAINEELKADDGILVNLASNEYFKSIKAKNITGEIITCNFKDNKNGVYKTVMTYAKNARGKMTRFIIENDLKNKEEIKTFDVDGYIFNPRLSSDEEYIFTRG